MIEMILIQRRNGVKSRWHTIKRITDAEIKAYGITPQAVAQKALEHRDPLDILFTPPTEYRVVYRLEEEFAHFTVSTVGG